MTVIHGMCNFSHVVLCALGLDNGIPSEYAELVIKCMGSYVGSSKKRKVELTKKPELECS